MEKSFLKTGFMSPLKGRLRQKKFCGLDIETYGNKNEFLLAGVYSEKYKKIFRSKEEWFNFLLLHQKEFSRLWFIATNLGFDFWGLFKDTEYEKYCYPIFRGSRLIIAKFMLPDKKNITFIDTLNFTFMSVKEMGEYIGLHKMDIPEYIKGKRKPLFSELPYIEKYCMRDCEITYKFALFLQESFNKLGCNIKHTLASTSMDLFKRKFLDERVYRPSVYQINEIKNAYYGGRTEAFKRGLVKNIYKYDYKSHYPSVMRNIFPHPNYMRIKKGNYREELINYEGVSLARVKSPENLCIPFLPYRGKSKLLFPLGEWEGWYAHCELRKAISLGYKVRFIKTYYYTKNWLPFQDYVKSLYSLRKTMQLNNDPMQLVVKILMNSLYGKFAQRLEQENIIHVNRLKKSDLINASYQVIDGTDYVFIKKKFGKFIPSFINPILSIYVTAYGRIKLYDGFLNAGLPNVYYCDTDSIFTSSELETGFELGDLCLENFIKEGVIIKPKLYKIFDGQKYEYKAKGIRIYKENKKEIWDKIINSEKIKQERFIKFKSAIRSKSDYKYGKLCVNQVIEIEKRCDPEDNKRQWVKKFSPYEMQESFPLRVYAA